MATFITQQEESTTGWKICNVDPSWEHVIYLTLIKTNEKKKKKTLFMSFMLLNREGRWEVQQQGTFAVLLYNWPVPLFIIAVWLLAENTNTSHTSDILYGAGISCVGIHTSWTWSLWWQYLPCRGEKAAQNVKHLKWFCCPTHTAAWTHTYTHIIIHCPNPYISGQDSQKKKINRFTWLQLPSTGWCSGFVQYLYLYIICYKEFLWH